MAHIKTFARLKPSKYTAGGNYHVSGRKLTIQIPDTLTTNGQVFRNSLSYEIPFNQIFATDATQQDVFDNVAQDIIDNFLIGFNGTIFAYGQTGTGKTYTVEGNSCRYECRGLATRALSMIYAELEKRTDEHIAVYLSFLEIYKEVAYDLLNPASRTMIPVLPFPKVTVVEGNNGGCVMRGLSLHLAANEDVAQMLLLQGQANRKVAETALNQRSSRSHAVFTVYLQSRKKDSQIILSSKLHLVDLAGSERVSKTGADGQQLTEAKSINLSLHHLETVIICLQESEGVGCAGDLMPQRYGTPQGTHSGNSLASNGSSDSVAALRRSRKHIPYRNSLLTMILKDSLGGNCLTAMIATISIEPDNLGESISTCRFAQRVARIANFAKRNEEIDDKMLIKKLKLKVAQLETKLALIFSHKDNNSNLEHPDQLNCCQVMEDYLQGIINDPVSAGVSTEIRFRECLNLMKHRMLESGISTIKSNKQIEQEDKPIAKPPQTQPITAWSESDQQSSPSPPNTIDVPSHEILPPFTLTTIAEVQNSNSDEEAKLSVVDGRHESSSLSSRQHRNGKTTKKKEEFLPDENGLDVIDRLLLAASSTSTGLSNYKTPYERKREQKIKKLGSKLNNLAEEKAVQEQDLELMKQNTVLDSLRMEEDGMRLKLQVADEQVADQHAYILHLKHIEADPELLTQESLVEKQLTKRQAKFQSKLDDILWRRKGVERELSQTPSGKMKPQPHSVSNKSIEEKFGQFKQNKGNLNTRQVFDMLKSEEKKQKKEMDKMEREKTLVKTKQLELKETATWEKLRELKQILKMSQKMEQQEQAEEFPHSPFAEKEVSDIRFDSPRMLTSQQSVMPSNNLSFFPSENSTEFVGEKHTSPVFSSNISHSEIISEYIRSVEHKIDRDLRGQQMTPIDVESPNSNSASKQKNRILSSENSNELLKYSNKGNSMALKLSPTVRNEQLAKGTNKQHYQSDLKTDGNNNSKSSQMDDFDLNLNLHKEDSFISDDFVTPNSSKNVINAKHSIFSSQSSHDKQFSNRSVDLNPPPSVHDGTHLNLALDTQSVKSKSSTISTKQNSIEEVTQDSTTHNNENNSWFLVHKLLPPSEYINSMTEQERFDARKMGLSSRTFESALSHMLDDPSNDTGKMNAPRLPYSVDVYNKFTRTSPHKSQKMDSRNTGHRIYNKRNDHINSSHGNENIQSAPAKSQSHRKVVENPCSTWGPNIKNVSIADRLTSLFDDKPRDIKDGLMHNQIAIGIVDRNNAIIHHQSPGQGNVGVVIDESCDEEDSFFGQQTPRSAIKALKKEEGESTFMSRAASERERISKIRKARHAAEVIQKHWRKFKSK